MYLSDERDSRTELALEQHAPRVEDSNIQGLEGILTPEGDKISEPALKDLIRAAVAQDRIGHKK